MGTKNRAVKLAMGLQKTIEVRMEQPLRSQLDALYRQLFDGLPGPHMTRFIGFCLSEGMAAVRARHGRRSRLSSRLSSRRK